MTSPFTLTNLATTNRLNLVSLGKELPSAIQPNPRMLIPRNVFPIATAVPRTTSRLPANATSPSPNVSSTTATIVPVSPLTQAISSQPIELIKKKKVRVTKAGKTRQAWLMTTKVDTESITCSIPSEPSAYERCYRNGRINFFWDGLDPERDELLRAVSNNKRPENYSWLCAFCNEFFPTKNDINHHMTEVHLRNARFHVCSICGKRFPAKFLLQRHESNHKYDPIYPHMSYVDSKGVATKELVENHYLCRVKPPISNDCSLKDALDTFSRLSLSTYTCLGCPLEFLEAEDVMKHYNDNHAAILCELCTERSKNFPEVSYLKTHLIMTHGLDYMRDYNGGYGHLWQYVRAHEQFANFAGTKSLNFFHTYAKPPSTMPWILMKKLQLIARFKRCHRQTASDLLKQKYKHLILVENSRQKTEEAQVVENEIMELGNIRMKSVNTEEEFPESVLCGLASGRNPTKIIPSPTSRRWEMKLDIHTRARASRNVSRRRCKICGLWIAETAWYRHSQTHIPEPLFKCDVPDCVKKFKNKSSLQLHQRAHAEDRQHRCQICWKSYNYSSLLVRHKRIHSGEKPYQCRTCLMNFHELVSLKYHVNKVHTLERPHTCKTCGKGFILRSDLNKHTYTHLPKSTPRPKPKSVARRASPPQPNNRSNMKQYMDPSCSKKPIIQEIKKPQIRAQVNGMTPKTMANVQTGWKGLMSLIVEESPTPSRLHHGIVSEQVYYS